MIERAVITARDGHLNLDRALPECPAEAPVEPARPDAQRPQQVRTIRELEDLERQNLVLALEGCSWRITGDKGAARLLGIKPSTLSSRLKALGIKRPANV